MSAFRPRDVYMQCVDMWGRPGILDAGTWEYHIVVEHPEMAGLDEHNDFSPLDDTIRQPHRVMHDKRYPNRESFYRVGGLPGYPRQYLKVCVEFHPMNWSGIIVGGTVVTSYPNLPASARRGAEMAMSNPESQLRVFHPIWPDANDLAVRRSLWSYDRFSDTMMVHFAGKPLSAVAVPLDIGPYDYLFARIDPETDRVVGVQIEDFLAFAVYQHPYLA